MGLLPSNKLVPLRSGLVPSRGCGGSPCECAGLFLLPETLWIRVVTDGIASGTTQDDSGNDIILTATPNIIGGDWLELQYVPFSSCVWRSQIPVTMNSYSYTINGANAFSPNRTDTHEIWFFVGGQSTSTQVRIRKIPNAFDPGQFTVTSGTPVNSNPLGESECNDGLLVLDDTEGIMHYRSDTYPHPGPGDTFTFFSLLRFEISINEPT